MNSPARNSGQVTSLPRKRYMTAEAVRAELQCSRSQAYDLLRQAAGRGPGARGLLRVTEDQ